MKEDAVASPEGRGLLHQLEGVLLTQSRDQLDGRGQLGELGEDGEGRVSRESLGGMGMSMGAGRWAKFQG